MMLWLLGAALADEPCTYIGIASTDLGPPSGCATTVPRHMRSFPKNFKIRSTVHPALHNTIAAGFEAWNGAGTATPNPSTKVDFRWAGTTLNVNFGDKKYTVSSVSSTWMQNNGLVGDPMAHTLRAFRGPNHSTDPCALKGADIIINSSYLDTLDTVTTLVTNPDPITASAACNSQSAVWPSCAVSLETLIAHEVGHVLGMGHALDTLQLMSVGYPYSGDAGPGLTGLMGEDYECLREAQENIDTHPAFEWV